MAPRFLDTNILLRYLRGDHPAHSPRALALLTRVERGEERVVTSPLVLFEVIFTLQSFYKVPREQIARLVLPIVGLPGLQLPDKAVYAPAFDLYTQHRRLSFADAFNAAYMRARGLGEIYTFDTDFEEIPGISRVEPEGDEE